MFELYSGNLGNYYSAITAEDRSWSAMLLTKTSTTSGYTTVPRDNLKSFVLTDSTTDNKNIMLGGVRSGKLNVSLTNLSSNYLNWFYKGQAIKMQLELFDTVSNSNILMRTPVFVVDEYKAKKRQNGNYEVEITAYDMSFLMSKSFKGTSSSMTAQEIVSSIASKYGLTVDSSVASAISGVDGSSPTQFPILEGFTDKQTLGYIAGCYGCFAKINEALEIEFVWYNETYPDIERKSIYSGGITTNDCFSRTFVMLETGTKDNVIVVPNNANGYSINTENPYITKAQAENFYNKRISSNRFVIHPGKIKYKGNPLAGAGSRFNIEDITNGLYNFYVMKRTVNYDGGYSETIECLGESETSINFKLVSPLQQRVDRAISRMEEAIKDATDIITQTKGSVFEFIPIDETDPTKGNSGWKLYSTDIGKKNVILANSSGIGFSSNGGQSFNAAAIYIDENGDGHINGNFITAGSISADAINTSAIVVGGGSYDDLGSLLDGVVNTANNSITSVDVLYAKSNSSSAAPTKPTKPSDEATYKWFTSAPPLSEGEYMWTLTKTISGGVASYSDPVCITSASGAAAKDGVGIENVTNYYLATSASSGVTVATSGWTDTVQTITSTQKYLWNYEVINYTDGSDQATDPVIIGTYGEKGSTGKGILSITEYYAVNDSSSTPPSSFSTTVAKPTSTNKYLWNYEVIAYTDGSDPTSTAKRIIGVYGDTGATGDKGQSVKAVVEQYVLTASNTQKPLDNASGWSEKQPSWSSGKYIWTRSKITWERPDGTTYDTVTSPVLAQAINGANETANSANTTATSTSDILSALTEKATANNAVYIKGGMIAAGSVGANQIQAGAITADKLTVGAITVGLNTNYCELNQNNKSSWGFDSYFSSDKSWLAPTSWKGNYPISNWYSYQNGTKLKVTGQMRSDAAKNGSYLGTQITLEVQYSDNTTGYCVESTGADYINGSSSYPITKVSWIIDPSKLNTSSKTVSKFRVVLRYASSNVPTSGRTYIKGVMVVACGIDGGIITAGKIQSHNGNSYFDLENDLIHTDNAEIVGGSIKIGGADYYTEIKDGSLTQHLTNETVVGGLIPVGTSSGNAYQALYFKENNAKGIHLGYQNNEGSFNYLLELTKSKMFASVPIESSGTAFSGLSYTRTVDSSVATVKTGVGDWGDITSSVNFGGVRYNNTTKAYNGNTYYISSPLTKNSEYYPLTKWFNVARATKLRVSFNYCSYGYTYFYICYKTASQMGTSGYYASSSFLFSQKGDADKTDGYYYADINIPDDAEQISIRVRPENGNSSYWAGWRNVSLKLVSGKALSGALEFYDADSNTTKARLDILESTGEAVATIRLTSNGSHSGVFELGAEEIWFNSTGILSAINDLNERLSALE